MAGTDLTFNIAWITKNTQAIDKLTTTLDRVGVKLDELDHKKANPKVGLDTSEFNRKITTAEKGIDAFSQRGQTQLIALAATLGAGALAGGALAALPIALGAIGIAAEKSSPQVKTAFADLTSTAKETAAEGFSPLVPAITHVADTAKTDLGNVKGYLVEASQAASPLLQSVGDKFLAAAQHGIGDSVPIIQSMRPVAQALGGDFANLEQGAVGFLGNLNTESAAQGVSILGQDVQQLLPAFGSLLSEAIPLGNALLSDLGPGLVSVAHAGQVLTPVLNGAAAVVSFLGPDVRDLAPFAVAAAGATKLLTGSWTDFAGSIAKGSSLLTNLPSTLDKLGQKIGFTSAATNQAKATEAAELVVKSELAKANADLAVAEAEAAFAAETTEKNALALVAAQEAQTAAATEATAAEAALAATSEAATFSFAPLGIALGAVALLALPFITNTEKAKQSTEDLSQQIIQLGNAAPQTAANLAGTNADLQKISGELGTVGSSATVFSQAYSGSLDQAKRYTNDLVGAQQKLGDSMVKLDPATAQLVNRGSDLDAVQLEQGISIRDLANKVNGSKQAYDALDPTLKRQVDRYNAYNDVVPQAQNALKNMRAEQAAEQAALQREGIVLDGVTQQWNDFGNIISQKVTDFNTATAGVKGITDNLLAADSTFFQAQDSFRQLDQAATQAGQAFDQSKAAIDSARHSVDQARQSVDDARHSEKQAADQVVTAEQGVRTALRGVVTAEQQVAQAKRASQTAEQNLMAARKAAAQQLADFNRQLTDQGDSEAEARLRVLDAQNAVNDAHLHGRTLASLGPLSSNNEADYKILLQLQEAQHNLNDVLAQGKQLQQQADSARRAGINGNQQVVSAQQQVTQAQQQQQQAAQGLHQAQQGVVNASKAVKDAQDAERQAHLATTNAQFAERQAENQLKAAKDASTVALAALNVAKQNDSRSTDINSAAGLRNFQTIENLYEAYFTATGNTDAARIATEKAGKQFGITKGDVDNIITSITRIPKTTKFSVIGLPSLDIDQLVRQATNAGISPFNIGIPRALAQGALADIRGHATGGRLSGPGTGTSDSMLIRASSGEFVVNAAATARYLPFLEAINAPGFASGGFVDPKALLGVNLRLMAYDTIAQGLSNTLHMFGLNTPNLPKGNGKVDFTSLLLGGPGDTGAHSGDARVAQAYAASQLGRYGWGAGQMAPLIKLWNQESGWNAYAVNPSSGAYGIPQSLGHGHPYDLGDYVAQINWGLNYIKGRYGSPEAAWGHEELFNWYRHGGMVVKPPKAYDNGGMLPPGLSLTYNGTGRPENVRTGAQEDALLAELRGLRADIAKLPHLTVNGSPNHSVDQLAAEVMRRFEFAGRG